MINPGNKNLTDAAAITTSIAPWLSVADGPKAIEFYKSALNAIEVYRLEMPDGGLVVRLSVNGAEFWVSAESAEGNNNFKSETSAGGSVRMIITVSDPDDLFAKALKAGATEIFPIGEEHGWRLGRLSDPFGLHWEIGRPMN